MNHSFYIIFLWGIPSIIIAFISIFIGMRTIKKNKLQKIGLAISLAPNIIFIILLFSLMIHMYTTLGGWPETIARIGFTKSLNFHADITFLSFYLIFMATIFVIPVLCLIFLFNDRLRRVNFYLGIHSFCFFIACAVLLLCPQGFLIWWWD